MAAPKGNRFWEVATTYGREKMFKTPGNLWSAACEYFEWVESNPLWENKATQYQGDVIDVPVDKMRAMTVQGLCLFLNIDMQTLENYGSKDGYEEYFGIVSKIKAVIYNQKFTGASAGLLNANIIARDLGLQDNTKNELTGANGGSIKTESKVEWVVNPVRPLNKDEA